MLNASVVKVIFVGFSVTVLFVTILLILYNCKLFRGYIKLLKKIFELIGDIKVRFLKRTPKKSLDQIIDSYIYSEEKNLRLASTVADDNTRYENAHPPIQSEVLELLKKAEGLTHCQEIMRHLSGIFPDVDSNTLMIELAKLERSRKVEAWVVGGDVHYQLMSNSLN